VRSLLDADVLEQQRHAGAAADSDAVVVDPTAHAHELARLEEGVPDAGGPVAELVRQIGVPARPVEEGAAVRADAAAEEGPRRGVDVAALP
jgi:hypothetical protein